MKAIAVEVATHHEDTTAERDLLARRRDQAESGHALLGMEGFVVLSQTEEDGDLERSARSGAALSIVVLDLYDFKAVNDAGGHEASDRLLQAAARSRQTATRAGGDLMARVGGDEFGLLAPGTDEIGAHHLARRLTEALPEGVSASVGVATWDRAEGASDLVRRADRAMCNAKKHRRRQGGGPRSA